MYPVIVEQAVPRCTGRGGEAVPAGRKTRRGVVIDVPLARRDLAELVITSPYTISRILAEWRRLDILDAQRTRIRIQDSEQLAAIAAQPVPGADVASRIS
jgi:Crp-like helix-turn-helix protein